MRNASLQVGTAKRAVRHLPAHLSESLRLFAKLGDRVVFPACHFLQTHERSQGVYRWQLDTQNELQGLYDIQPHRVAWPRTVTETMCPVATICQRVFAKTGPIQRQFWVNRRRVISWRSPSLAQRMDSGQEAVQDTARGWAVRESHSVGLTYKLIVASVARLHL